MRDGDAAERVVAALRAPYTDVHVETVEKSVPDEPFAVALEEAGEVVDVRVWVERDDEVLLVRDRNRPDAWMEPGETPESEEDFERTARREVTE